MIELCESSHILRLVLVIKYVIRIITILLPLILIYLGTSHCIKLVISGKMEEFKDKAKQFAKQIIIALAIFFIPTIVNYAVTLVGASMYEVQYCYDNATVEEVKYYEKIEHIVSFVNSVKDNPTKERIEEARKKVTGMTSYAKEDTMISLLRKIEEAEENLEGAEKRNECINKGGVYQKGYCTELKKWPSNNQNNQTGSTGTTGGTSTGNSGTSYNPVGTGTGGLISYSGFGGQYNVVGTAASVESYAKIVANNRIAQNNDSSKYGGYCLAFSYIHAYSMYSGNTSARAPQAIDYLYAGKFSSYISDSKQDVLSKVYNELINGRPCILHVNGNKKGTSRHFVTVVGMKKSVTSGDTIQESDLLIMDSWDGKIEQMGVSGSRFMITGADCHKNYSGWRMGYIKQ